MSKRSAQMQPKLFSLNLESLQSLLLSDESQGEQNDVELSSTESCKHPKKFKAKDCKPLPANKIKMADETSKTDVTDQNEEDEEIEEIMAVSKFFENVENDFGKSIQMRKTKLGQFTDAVISTYESKLEEMVKRQEFEVKKFKEQALANIHEELIKEEEEFKKLKLQETKIIKALEQQIKLFQKTAMSLEASIQNFNKVHKNFIQTFEDLKVKHQNEVLELKKSLGIDMSVLQNKFLTESKKEEMKTVKKYLSTIYF